MVKLVSKKYNVYLIAGLGSLLLALLTRFYHQPFDVDGLLYLHTAKAFLTGGLHASLKVYPWAFYPILIAITSKITTLSLLHSTFILNTVLDLLGVWMFIAVIKQLGGSKILQLLGALLILTLPYLNHYRGDILKGHGYYAFALLAILLLMRFASTRQWRYAISWSIAMLVATLFRAEGAVLFAALPLALLFQKERRVLAVLQAYTVQIITALALINIYLLLHFNAIHFGLLTNITTNTPHSLFSVLRAKHQLIAATITGHGTLLRTETTYFLGGGITGIFLGVLLRVFGITFPLLAGYAIFQKCIPTKNTGKPIYILAVLLNLLIPAVFLLKYFYISERYFGLLMILLLLAVPFAIQKIYQNYREHKPTITGSRWLFIIVVIGVAYNIIAGIGHFGPSKTYIIKSGYWVKKHAPTNSKFCTSDTQLFYYTGERGQLINSAQQLLHQYKTKQCNYIAIKVPRHASPAFKAQVKNLPAKSKTIFGNKRGDKAYIIQGL